MSDHRPTRRHDAQDDAFPTSDPLAALADTDRPVEPRPQFAVSLNTTLRRLASELGPEPETETRTIDTDKDTRMPEPQTDNKTDTDDKADTGTPSGTPTTGSDDNDAGDAGDARPYLADLGGVSNLFYFTVPAPDIERARTFYSTVLGWQVGGGSLGGHVANITPPGGLDPTATSTATHVVYLTVFDLDAAMARVRELGGTVEGTVDYETGRMARCRDDQGSTFCLQEPSAPYRDHALNPTRGSANGDLFYFSIPVRDGQAGRRFYQDLLGWDLSSEGEAGGMHAGNMITDGGLGANRDGEHPEFWFRVDDLAATLATVRAAGGTAGDPLDTPEGVISQCVDDQGVEFGLIQPALTDLDT